MRLIVLGLSLFAAGCTTGVDRRVFLNTLVGAPETEVIRQLGVPTRSFEAGGHLYLAYDERRTDYVPATPFFFGFGGGYYGPGFGYGYGFPPSIVERSCEMTFDIVQGRVVTWALRGNACG